MRFPLPNIFENAAKKFLKSTDNFDQMLTRNSANKGDLAAHYELSPERYRFLVNGNQRFLAYGVPSELTDSIDSFDINPNAGDTNTFRTAERFRYAVGYTVSVSWAEQVNQSLHDHEVIARGFGDTDQANASSGEALGPSADGWFLINTAHLDDNEVRFVIARNGTIKSDRTVRTNRSITSHRRFEIEFDWYNVGSARLTESYIRDGEQINEVLEEIGVDNDVAGIDKGPETGNKQIEWSVTEPSGNGSLIYKVGSSSVITNGQVDPITRDKTARLEVSYGSNNDKWIPVAALRENDSRKVVNTQLKSLEIANKSSSGADVQVLAIPVNESNTDASGFSTPDEHSPENSVLEQTTSVTTHPDPSNSSPSSVSTTSNALDDPGGYQVGYASIYATGQGQITSRSTTTKITPRNFYPDDVILILARSSEDGITFSVEHTTTQQW